MGVGEPMSVGELVAVDGCDSVGAWAGDDECDDWSCRLLLGE